MLDDKVWCLIVAFKKEKVEEKNFYVWLTFENFFTRTRRIWKEMEIVVKRDITNEILKLNLFEALSKK